MKNTPWTFDERDFKIRDNDGNTIALVKFGVPNLDLLDLIAIGHLMASAPGLVTPSNSSQSSDPSSASAAALENPLRKLLSLIAQLPAGLQASSRETNSFSLTATGDGWIAIGTLFAVLALENPVGLFANRLDRIQLLLDLAAAAKAAESLLQYMVQETH